MASVPPDNAGYVVAAYLVTAGALGGFILRLTRRARRARLRTQAIIERRDGPRS
jgi:heme exporter protein CcmD